MTVRLVIDEYRQRVALYCSTDMRAFGPVFTGHDAEEQAEDFIKLVEGHEGKDIRKVPGRVLDTWFETWMSEREATA